MSTGVYAAPTILSPVDYSSISTMTAEFRGYLDDPNFTTSYFNFEDYGEEGSIREAQRAVFKENSAPVTVSWSGSSGTCTVKLWRTYKDSASSPVFTKTTTGTSVEFYDLEIGRNYTWTVTDSTGTATGHFYTMRHAPRMIKQNNGDTEGAACSNGRDIGGRLTEDGTKAIKQGLIYRTAQIEYCNPRDSETGIYSEMTWLKNTLGIKLDVDLRTKAHLTEYYVGSTHNKEDSDSPYAGEYKFRYDWKNGSYLDTIEESSIGEGVVRYCVNAKTGQEFPSWASFFNNTYKKSVWYAFNAIYESVKKGEPVIFHCSHGKDRGGTLAFVIHGVLGTSESECIKDFGISWFDNPDETLDFDAIDTEIVAKLATYSGDTLQEQCEAYLADCGVKAGITEAAAKTIIADFQSLMLEDIELIDADPNSTVDTFEYTNYYFRRSDGGGSWSSSTGYWYTHPTDDSKKCAGGTNPNSYNNCYFFQPTKSLPYAYPVSGKRLTGKIVVDATYAAHEEAVGAYAFKPHFSNDGHSVSDRCIFEHRAGQSYWENLDIYLVELDGTASTYSGTASIDVWGGSTMVISDFYAMTPSKTYLNFPANNCYNSRLESVLCSNTQFSELGWFTGGAVGATQYLKVDNSYLKFSASGKTSGVAGNLALEFALGTNIYVSTSSKSKGAMLQVTGTLKLNAGSTVSVDAGGKGAGTYKLVSAGTLTDNANLTLRTNYVVENCASGYYGTIVKSGNALNLVIEEGEAPTGDVAVSASASYVTYPDPKFTVSGSVELGEGTTTATLYYSLSGGTQQTVALTLGSDGSFSVDIPYTSVSDSLTWYVKAENVNGDETMTGQSASTTTARAADSSATTYVWTGNGGDGKWTNCRNWTSTNTSAYGYPANGTYATAEFPESITDAFTCTLDKSVSVNLVHFYSPNINFVVDNAKLAVKGKAANYVSYYFGNGIAGGNPTIEIKGENGSIMADSSTVRANFGDTTGDTSIATVCTVKFTVPATGWTATAPLTAPGYDSKVVFYHNAKVVIDATALGVPEDGTSKSVLLATGTGDDGAYLDGSYEIVCAAGAQGSVAISNKSLVLTVTADEAVSIASIEALLNDKPYTGVTQTSGLADTSIYTVSADEGGTDVGDYSVTVTLASDYIWDDETTGAKTFTWSIVKAVNEWTVSPAISPNTWMTGTTAGTLSAGATKFGSVTATIAKDGSAATAFDGALPTDVGSYVITYTAPVGTTNYDVPAETAKSVSFTITEYVEYVAPVTNAMENAAWGYIVTNLGENFNETAVVFTNHTAAMTWTAPADLQNVKFLVVGGGGGGGADFNPGSGSAPFLGGGGGGGGGVVTGVVASVASGTEFAITVGAGGAKGQCTNTKINGGYGASYAGADSTISLNDVAVITAFGGGNDKGVTDNYATTGNVGGTGGSNAGSRAGNSTAQGTPTCGDVNDDFVSNLVCYGVLGNKGGFGNTGESFWGFMSASGGGGGATEAGGTPSDYATGGKGGEGFATDITGTLLVYGSGGGGGTISFNLGGKGGTGAGDGNIETGNGAAGQDALANQGGGGGGGGRSGDGGNGGSGIVVFRYSEPVALPEVGGSPIAADKVFDAARVSKSITYPTEPTLAGQAGSQTITWNSITVNVPAYYTASLSGNVVTLALNDNARPVIANATDTDGNVTAEAIEIVDGKVTIHIENAYDALYYALVTSTSLGSDATWTTTEFKQGRVLGTAKNYEYTITEGDTARFFQVTVKDEE